MLLVMGCAWAYVRYRSLPQVDGILYGIKPVLIAVVVQALWHLGRKCLRSTLLAVTGLLAVALAFGGVHELLILALAGLAVAGWKTGRGRPPGTAGPLSAVFAAALPAAGGSAAAPFGLGPLFLFFLKVGSVLYGSGYVLLAFLRADLVERYGWLTDSQLLDAVAVGQVTPGPVFTTATFIGYLLGGPAGAVTATVGIFLPAFVFVALSGPLIPRLRRSAFAGAFLDGVNVASLALMAVVTLQLGRASLVDLPTLLLGLGSTALLVTTRVNSVWLILAGGGLGFWLAG